MAKDIFSLIAERDRTPKIKIKAVTRHRIMRGSGGYANSKLYTKKQAERIITRASKRGLDLYLGDPMKIKISVID